MLATARALMTNPALLLLDEPLEGLAPIIVEELTAAIRRMIADQGTAVILVEQHAEVALSLTKDAIAARARRDRASRPLGTICLRITPRSTATSGCGFRRIESLTLPIGLERSRHENKKRRDLSAASFI